MEVLSPRTEKLDRRTKYDVYARAGVREYWLVHPEERSIEIFVLRGQAYAPLGAFGPDDQTRSEVLPGFAVQVAAVCPA